MRFSLFLERINTHFNSIQIWQEKRLDFEEFRLFTTSTYPSFIPIHQSMKLIERIFIH